MLGSTFWKSEKLIPSEKNQSVLIAKISSCKIQNMANLQKLTPAKISCHTVYGFNFWVLWMNPCGVTS